MRDKTQILVAEDEAMLRVLAVEMLEDCGFHVFEAGDGEEALALLRAYAFLHDLTLDEVASAVVARRLRIDSDETGFR